MSLRESAIRSNKRLSTSMASEHSILTDVAHSLGTYQLNREDISKHNNLKPITSIREEAELLLNFMATIPSAADTSDGMMDALLKSINDDTEICLYEMDTDEISPSFSFESKRSWDHGSKNHLLYNGQNQLRVKPCSLTSSHCVDLPKFQLICPSLSLDKVLSRSSLSSISSHNTLPSTLFSRPIKLDSISPNELDGIASTLASNFMDSFITAIDWRMKTWIKSLSKVLSLQYQIKFEGAAKYDSKYIESIKDKMKQSHEARVINSLAKASKSIAVHDIRTTFFVLEEQRSSPSTLRLSEEKKDEDIYCTPAKLMKVGFGIMRDSELGRYSQDAEADFYEITHSITLDTRFSVSISNLEKIDISFKTPGILHGTFSQSPNGTSQLKKISINLDTDDLALNMDKNSRVVLRTASKEFMAGISKDICTIYDTVQTQAQMASGNQYMTLSDVSNRRDEIQEGRRYLSRSDPRYDSQFCDSPIPGPLVTPTVECQETISTTMAPPPPRIPFDTEEISWSKRTFINPRRVSPSAEAHHEGTEKTSDLLVSPTPSKTTFMDTIASKKEIVPYHDLFALPSLVSPNPIQHKPIDQHDYEQFDAPALPSLIQSSRITHAKCH